MGSFPIIVATPFDEESHSHGFASKRLGVRLDDIGREGREVAGGASRPKKPRYPLCLSFRIPGYILGPQTTTSSQLPEMGLGF